METKKRILKTVVDISNGRLKGIIGEMTSNGVNVLEQADALSGGIEKSIITDTSALSGALGTLIDKLKKSNRLIDRITLGVSGKGVKSKRGEVIYKFEEKRSITEKDVTKFIEKAKNDLLTSREVVLHNEIYNIKVDNLRNIKSPVGRLGSQLQASVYFIYMERDEYKKYEEVCSKLNLKIENILSSSYAAALSTLRAQDRKNGIIMVDIGENSIDIVIYAYDKLIFLESAHGGIVQYISDLTHLPTYVEYKTKNYTSGDRNTISEKSARDILGRFYRKEILPQKSYTKDGLTYMGDYIKEIIDIRSDVIAQLIKDLLIKSKFSEMGKKIIITGGGANIEGLEEKISDITQKNTKKLLPVKIPGLKSNATAFASVIGLFGEAIDSEYKKILSLSKKSEANLSSASEAKVVKKSESVSKNPMDEYSTNTTYSEKSPPTSSVNPNVLGSTTNEVPNKTSVSGDEKYTDDSIEVAQKALNSDFGDIKRIDEEETLKDLLDRHEEEETLDEEGESFLKKGYNKFKEWFKNFE